MHGGGMTWGAGTYDPALNLLYFGTGNAQPVIAGKARPGDNLYTGCLIAVNPDTGKMAWYFQPTPHETHDWDAIETPVLFDGVINGQPRRIERALRDRGIRSHQRRSPLASTSSPTTSSVWSSRTATRRPPLES